MKKAGTIQQYIKYFVDEANGHMRPYIVQGKLNNEFIRGNQNRGITKNLSIEEKLVDKKIYTERKVFNRLLPIYLTRYGILSQNMPIAGVEPTSSSSKDVADSININNFVQDYMRDVDFPKIYKRAIKHADIYGLCWFKTGIDWSEGDLIGGTEATVGENKGELTIREGRPFVAAVPMHEVFVDSPYIESIEEVNELVHRRVFSLDYIRNRWGFEARAESINDAKLSTYPRYSNLGMANSGSLQYAYIYEYYKRADAVYKEGRYTVVCNDAVIYDGKLPYENGSCGRRKIPFDFFNMQSVPNYLSGVTVYSQLIPIQETYNAIKNRYLEYINHVAIGQLYYWEGSLENKNNFTTKPGKLIALKRNARKPEPVQKDKISMEFINYLRALEEDMLVTAGLSQMTAFGSSKSSVRTDGVVDKLSESDENKLSNALDNIADCLVAVFKKLIYLEKARVNRLIKDFELAKLDCYTAKYNLQDVDAEQVTIVNREFLMQSDQMLDKKLQQVIAMGLYQPNSPITYNAKLELLNAMHANYLRDTLDPQERATHNLCREENLQMLEDKVVPEVTDYHIHDQHILEHTLFRISPEIRKLKKEDAGAYTKFQQAVDLHIASHQQKLVATNNQRAFNNAKAVMSTPPNRGQGSRTV